MYTENYAGFLGDGSNNAAGENLHDFLEKYNPKMYDNPSNTVDNLIFTYVMEENTLVVKRLLLIKRGNHPSIGWWAMPGGFVEYKENLDVAAARELLEETGIEGLSCVDIGTFGDYDRDPRTRIITTAFLALVEDGMIAKAGDDADSAAWFELSFDKINESDIKITFSAEDEVASAVVRKNVLNKGFFTEIKYTTFDNDKICADHPSIIMKGLDYILNNCNCPVKIKGLND